MNAVRLGLLPPPVFSPEVGDVGGFIAIVDQFGHQESFRLGILGWPQEYIGSVQRIRRGLPLFIFRSDTFTLFGVFKAESNGGLNIDPSFLPNPINPCSSLFPAQVRFSFSVPRLMPLLPHFIFTRIATYYPFGVLRPALTTPQTRLLLEILEIHRRINIVIDRLEAP